MAQQSHEHYRERIVQAHADVKTSLHKFFEWVLPGEHQAVENVRLELEAAVTTLDHLLPEGKKPHWLMNLKQELKRYGQQRGQANASLQFLQAVSTNYVPLLAEKWTMLGEPADEGIDFDGIFGARFDASKANELFQKLLTLIQEMIAVDLLDSRIVISELERLAATIKKSLAGSQFAKWQASRYAKSFFKHLAWEGAQQIPIIGTIVTAARATIDELSAEMEKVESLTNQDIQNAVRPGLRAVENVPRALLSLLPDEAPKKIIDQPPAEE